MLEIISEFSKVSGYKISIHKSLGSLYTNNEKSERKTKGTIIFTTATTTTKIEYLGRTLPKQRSWHLITSLLGKQMEKQWKQWLTLFWGAPKSLQIVTAALKLKDTYSLEEKL